MHHHSDTTAANVQFDKDVNMVQMFEESFIDPLDLSDPSDHLVNFAAICDIAPPEVEESLLNALDRGSQMASNFRKELWYHQMASNHWWRQTVAMIHFLSLAWRPWQTCKRLFEYNWAMWLTMNEVMYLRLLAVNAFKKVPLERVLKCYGTGIHILHGRVNLMVYSVSLRRYLCCGSLLLLVLAVRIYTLVQLLC